MTRKNLTTEQIRMAKAALNWSFDEWADKTGLSKPGLRKLHNGEIKKPHEETANKIFETFEQNGLEFFDGGVKRRDIVHVYEGDDCYLRILDEIIRVQPECVMFSAADERRSTEQSMERLSKIREVSTVKNLIRHGDTYCMGALDEYRWMPEGLFADSDVKVMYDNTVVHFMSWMDTPRAIKIVDKNIAGENIRMFNYLFDNGEAPTTSTSDRVYE